MKNDRGHNIWIKKEMHVKIVNTCTFCSLVHILVCGVQQGRGCYGSGSKWLTKFVIPIAVYKYNSARDSPLVCIVIVIHIVFLNFPLSEILVRVLSLQCQPLEKRPFL